MNKEIDVEVTASEQIEKAIKVAKNELFSSVGIMAISAGISIVGGLHEESDELIYALSAGIGVWGVVGLVSAHAELTAAKTAKYLNLLKDQKPKDTTTPR